MLRQAKILLVEDSQPEVRLTNEAFRDCRIGHRLDAVPTGPEALKYLRREAPYNDVPRPDIVLLDLNLPLMDGKEVLKAIKSDPQLRSIPVVVLTTSESERDVHRAYSLHANCYIRKPVSLDRFLDVMKLLDRFWFSVARLPAYEV